MISRLKSQRKGYGHVATSAVAAAAALPVVDVEAPAPEARRDSAAHVGSIGSTLLDVARLAEKAVTTCAEQTEWAVPDQCEGLTGLAEVVSANPRHRRIAAVFGVLLLVVGLLALLTGLVTAPLISSNSKLLASSDNLIGENARLNDLLTRYKQRSAAFEKEAADIKSKHASVTEKLQKETTAHAQETTAHAQAVAASSQRVKELTARHEVMLTNQAALKSSIQRLINEDEASSAAAAP